MAWSKMAGYTPFPCVSEQLEMQTDSSRIASGVTVPISDVGKHREHLYYMYLYY